jgi:hypothetical protein
LPVCIAESRVDAVQLVKIDALDAKITQASFGTLTESACPPLALQQDHYDPVVQLSALYRECESCAGSLRRKSSVGPFDEEMPAALSLDGIHQLTVKSPRDNYYPVKTEYLPTCKGETWQPAGDAAASDQAALFPAEAFELLSE